MAVELDHTIVPAHDPQASAQFLAGILGLLVDPPVAQFTPVTLANGVSLDFLQREDVSLHHYAFQLSGEEFKAAFDRITDWGITYYADPGCRQPGQVYPAKDGRRGTYFRDPDGHLMEILTSVDGEMA
ncbi:MAG TPA: VOC family protein [Streptosporangiaceae bacterium]|jgi:catechol 2,3-dioxygenase-like lactoylglutathione lyase family enzyme